MTAPRTVGRVQGRGFQGRSSVCCKQGTSRSPNSLVAWSAFGREDGKRPSRERCSGAGSALTPLSMPMELGKVTGMDLSGAP